MVTEESVLERALVLQEHRLLVLHRQLLRGGHHVSSRVKRLERDYFTCKRRLLRAQRQILVYPRRGTTTGYQ